MGSLLAGLTYGGQWALMAATASELFGLAHFGTLYNCLAMGSPLSTYLLSARLAGWLYDREARRGRGRSLDGGEGGGWHFSRKIGWNTADGMLGGLWPSTSMVVLGKQSREDCRAGAEGRRLSLASEPHVHATDLASTGIRSLSMGAAPAPSPEGPPTCTGARCFRLTFLILTGVCLLGSGLNGWLAQRTRRFYRER